MSRLGAITNRTEVELEFQWVIHDFLTLDRKVDEFDISPEFRFFDETWYLKANLNGRSEDDSEGYINLYLESESLTSSKFMTFEFLLKRVDGTKKKLCKHQTLFKGESAAWGQKKLIRRSNLLERKLQLVPSGILTIICSLKLKDPSIVTETENLSEYFKKLLLSGNDSDVTFKVKGEEFRLHKIVLARSPVFSAMFKHEMKENVTGIVSVDDCEVDIFRMLLQYVYSGTVEKFSETNVFSLYQVADKYQLESLKRHCGVFIANILSVEMFFDVINLAILFDDKLLLKETSDLFSYEWEEIMKKDKWATFRNENSPKAVDLLTKALIDTL